MSVVATENEGMLEPVIERVESFTRQLVYAERRDQRIRIGENIRREVKRLRGMRKHENLFADVEVRKKVRQESKDVTPLSLMVDGKGRLWKWNCGWWMVNGDGKVARNFTKPLGHKAFARIPKATREELNSKTITIVDRPVGAWRRWTKFDSPGHRRILFEHETFGHGHVLANDGLHAIFKPISSQYHEDDPETVQTYKVMSANLTECKPPRGPGGGRKSSSPKTLIPIEDLL